MTIQQTDQPTLSYIECLSTLIKEELRIFCANSTIDEVYNTKFLAIVQKVRENVIQSIERLGDGGLVVLNLVIPKPDIPPDIAHNYKESYMH